MMDWILPLPVIYGAGVVGLGLAFWIMIEVSWWWRHRP